MGRLIAIIILLFVSSEAFSEEKNKEVDLKQNHPSSSIQSAPPQIGKSYFFDPENLHVLEIGIKPKVGKPELFDDLTEAYFHNKKLYLPLDQLFTIFDFPIVVKLKQGTAKGWFFRENYTFDLDLSTKTIQSKGQTYHFNSSQIIKGKEDVYIESSLLTEVTGIKFEHDSKLMRLIVDSPEPFPAILFK